MEDCIDRDLELPGNACDGHFPGRPVVPGVLMLVMVAEALNAGVGDELAVAAIPRVRFRRPVVPCDALRLEAASTGSSWRFQLRANDVVACDGILIVEPRPALDPHHASAAAALDGWPGAEACLPHRAPMLLVDGLLEVSGEGGVCRGLVGEDSPLARADQVPGLAGLEVAAQALGWLEAAAHPGRAAAREGYLVGIKGARLAAASFPVGAPLLARVRRTALRPPMVLAEVRVSLAGQEIVAGTLTTWADGEG